MVLSQNAKQFTITSYESAANLAAGLTQGGTVRAYSYTLYDKIGRITEVGELLTDKAVVTAKSESQVLYAAHEAFAGAGFKHQVSKTYYDINTTPPADWQPTYLRNRVAYTTYQQEQNKPVQETHYSYDVHGNVNRLLQVVTHDENVLAKTVDYEYDLISGKVNKVYYQKAQTDQLIHVYAYDGDNRITEVKTSTDNVLFTKEASYEYYAHGPLARTKTGELNVETQNYAYTVQGWIKQMQAEAFSYTLGYNEKDYTSIGSSNVLATPIATVGSTSKGLYNGNIASMTSKTPKMTEIPNQPAVLQQQYSYDQLNRITASNTPGAGNAYSTSYSYDANGNIKTLARYDGGGAKFDELSYNYETKTKGYLRTTNQLRWVDDAPTISATTADIEDQATDNYSYDAIGNLVKDNQEEIAKIEWTVSGKVRRVLRTATSAKPDLEFEYDASGQRIVKKVIKKDGTVTSTYYLRDASGNVMSVYSYNANSDNDPALTEQYLYGSSRIGVYTPAANVLSKTRSFGRKSYELSDHLGNVRATLSDYRRLASQQIVNSATDYYPFGSVARSYTSSQIYRYGFNGKEHEDDITGGDYAFEYRVYDSRLAQFLSIDPWSKKYPYQSPYVFAHNCPILLIDYLGLGDEPDRKHQVKAGDNISSLAKMYNVTEDAIRNANPQTQNRQQKDQVNLGEILNIPPAQAASSSTLTTRVYGGLKGTVGVVGMFGSAAFGAASSWTVVGAVAGGIGVAYSADVAASGFTQMITGEETQTLTHQGISNGLQAAGVSPANANTAATYSEGALQIAMIPIAGASKTTFGVPVIPVAASGASKYLNLFKPTSQFDPVRTLYRGTTGSETGATTIFLTDNAAVAATYVKNGGQVMEYQLADFSLQSLRFSGQLTLKTGTHGATGVVSTEYMFQGSDIVKALNILAKPLY